MKFLPTIAFAASALMLAGCGDGIGAAKPLNVVSGHIVMGATPDRPAVGYFRIQGGPQDVELVAVTSELAQRVEMHETVKEDGVLKMQPLARAAVPAKGGVEFKQGGKHLMIYNINPSAVQTGSLPMQFLFTNNDNERILFDMVIKPAPGGAADEHAGHDMDHADAADQSAH